MSEKPYRGHPLATVEAAKRKIATMKDQPAPSPAPRCPECDHAIHAGRCTVGVSNQHGNTRDCPCLMREPAVPSSAPERSERMDDVTFATAARLIEERYRDRSENAILAEARRARSFEKEHERCIEEMNADALRLAERENELSATKDAALRKAEEEIAALRDGIERDEYLLAERGRRKNAEARASRLANALVKYAAQLVMLHPETFREDGPEFVRRDHVVSIAMDLKKAAALAEEGK